MKRIKPGNYRACHNAPVCSQHASERQIALNPGDLVMPSTVAATEYSTHVRAAEQVRACRCGSHVVGDRRSFARVDDDK